MDFITNIINNMIEQNSQEFVWVLFGVPAVVVVVAFFVTIYAVSSAKKGKIWKNEEHQDILATLREKGDLAAIKKSMTQPRDI